METSQDSAVGANFWLENDFHFVVWKSKGVESRLQSFAWEPWLCFSWFQLPPGQFQRSILQLVASHPNRTTPKRQSCRRRCHRYMPEPDCVVANSQRRNVRFHLQIANPQILLPFPLRRWFDLNIFGISKLKFSGGNRVCEFCNSKRSQKTYFVMCVLIR